GNTSREGASSTPGAPSLPRRRGKLAEMAQVDESPLQAQPRTAPEPAPRTIGRLWHDAVSAGRTAPAYLVEDEGDWREVSWPEAARRVEEIANGLLALGVGKGDAVAIIGRTRLEWSLIDFALALTGAVGAPVYPTSSAADCAYIVAHSEAVVVFVEDEEQRAKIEAHDSELPSVRQVLSFDELEDVEARGREHAAANPGALAAATAEVGEDDLFTYIYTSGTTGPPKACMIRHRNYYAMADAAYRAEGVTRPDDVLLLYLPLAHNYGRLVELLGAYVGFTIAFCPDPYGAAEALTGVSPTLFPSVPRIYEKIHAAVLSRF